MNSVICVVHWSDCTKLENIIVPAKEIRRIAMKADTFVEEVATLSTTVNHEGVEYRIFKTANNDNKKEG